MTCAKLLPDWITIVHVRLTYILQHLVQEPSNVYKLGPWSKFRSDEKGVHSTRSTYLKSKRNYCKCWLMMKKNGQCKFLLSNLRWVNLFNFFFNFCPLLRCQICRQIDTVLSRRLPNFNVNASHLQNGFDMHVHVWTKTMLWTWLLAKLTSIIFRDVP